MATEHNLFCLSPQFGDENRRMSMQFVKHFNRVKPLECEKKIGG